MPYSTVLGLEPVIHFLQNAFQNQRIPSAYLFKGINGIGKSYIARIFSQKLNCTTNKFCQDCDSCKLFNQGRHPDFIILKPEGQFITVAKIHQLQQKLSLKPAFAKKRVVLIKNAEKMNRESCNAFLKTLEEPPLNTLLILTCSDTYQLEETILSRCQKINFPPLQRNHLLKLFENKFEIPETYKHFVLKFSHGSLRKELIGKSEVLYNLRAETFNTLESLVVEKMGDHFIFLQQIVKQNYHFYFIEFSMSWVRDLLLLNQEMPQVDLLNVDFIQRLNKMKQTFTDEQLNWMFQLMVETENAIKHFAGKILALESMLIQLRQVYLGKPLI